MMSIIRIMQTKFCKLVVDQFSCMSEINPNGRALGLPFFATSLGGQHPQLEPMLVTIKIVT